MMKIGRFISNAMIIGLFFVMYFTWSKIHPMFEFGDITYKVSWTVFVLIAVLVGLLVIDFALLGGPWAPLYPLVLCTLIFQNWLVGVLLAAISYSLLRTIGRIGIQR